MRIQVPDEAAGDRAKCPYCKQSITIPEESATMPSINTSSAGKAGPKEVILVGVEMTIPEMIVLAFKWSFAVFLVSVAWGTALGGLYVFVRWSVPA